MKRFFLPILAGILCGLSLPVRAQENPFLTRPHYNVAEDYFLETQEWQILDMVKKSLAANPPAPVNAAEKSPADLARKMALLAFDAVVHDTRYDDTPAIKEYVHGNTQAIIEALDEPVKDGLMIYHIYDMGFIVKSASTTVAFDLSGQGGRRVATEQTDRLVDRCDVLFITHRHGDHADRHVADRFLDQGKPVIVPPACWPDDERVLHQRNDDGVFSGKIKLAGGKIIRYKLFPGHQNETPTTWTQCNHPCVTFPEGYTVVSLGDQAHPEDNVWMKDARKEAGKVDVMLVTCWMGDTGIIIPGYDPRLVITGHANEMGHSITHRVPFWYAYHQYENFPDYPAIVMNWGESYHYTRR